MQRVQLGLATRRAVVVKGKLEWREDAHDVEEAACHIRSCGSRAPPAHFDLDRHDHGLAPTALAKSELVNGY